MAAAIKEEDFKNLEILWEDPDGKYKIIKRDEMNLEIIKVMRLGESGKGKKCEVRDEWCSIPMYYSNLVTAFNKMIEIKTIEKMTSGVRELEGIRDYITGVKDDFEKQVYRNIKNVL